MTARAERTAIITGGTRGIGRAIALRLAAGGVRPLLVHRKDEAAAQEAVTAARAIHPGAAVFRADLASPPEVDRLMGEIAATAAGIDVLVTSHLGRTPAAKVHQLDPAAWAEGIGQNLGGSFLMARAVLPAMIAAQHGRIVFVGSIAMNGERGKAAYAAAKSGLLGLARTIALEYAKDGITANVVAPGFVGAGSFLDLDPSLRERVLERVPARRTARADEVAGLVWYLIQPEAGYLTGQVIRIDGGV